MTNLSKTHFTLNGISVLFTLLLICPGNTFGQQAKSTTPIYSDKEKNFYIESVKQDQIITGNCSKPLSIRVVSRGECPGNLVLNWSVSYYDCNSKEQTLPFTIHIQKGQKNYSFSQPLKAVKIISMVAGTVQSRFVTPPSDFEIRGNEQIIEDDKASLRINTGNQPTGVKWSWQDASGKEIGQGTSITVQPLATTTYYVRSILEGFRSVPKSFTVKVNMKPRPPKNFNIVGKTTILEGDELALSVEAENAPDDLQWHWFRKGEDQPFDSGERITLEPKESGTYYVQGDLNGKKSTPKEFIVTVKKTPEPPVDFSINGPASIRENETTVLKVIAKTKPDSIRWFWYRENETTQFHEGETLTLTARETENYNVRAALYNKRSAPYSWARKSNWSSTRKPKLAE